LSFFYLFIKKIHKEENGYSPEEEWEKPSLGPHELNPLKLLNRKVGHPLLNVCSKRLDQILYGEFVLKKLTRKKGGGGGIDQVRGRGEIVKK
jgi:hypothetical protein